VIGRGSAIAGSCIVGVLGAVAITRAGANYDQAVLIWLISTVTCGALVYYQDAISEAQLWSYSVPSPSVLCAVLIYRMAFFGEAPLTGVSISFSKPRSLSLLVLFWCSSVAAIWLFAHARSLVLATLKGLTAMSKSQRGRVEQLLHWLVRVIGTGYLVVKAFTTN